MSQRTTTFKQSFSGSVGAGMGAIFNASDKRFYILEHKVSSKYHKAGESQKIIINNIEIGRDSDCQVRFDESFKTVSRKHAAIVKDGDNWTLVQLSKTNTTYLNGLPVKDRWYLQNGDEIQLSNNGPKLGFIIPQGDKSLVKSIGMTARLNLFRQQALKPYKTVMTILASILLICIAGGGYVTVKQHKEIKKQESEIANAKEQWELEKNKQDSTITELIKKNEHLISNAEERDQELDKLKNRIHDIESRPVQIPTVSTGGAINNEAINRCLPYVYYIRTIKFDVTLPDGEVAELDAGKVLSEDLSVPSWSGTGFLLSNGKFVTARHVAEGWYFWATGEGVNENYKFFNWIANNNGKIVCHFAAVSSSGNVLTFSSDQFICDRSNDVYYNDDDGSVFSLATSSLESDFAYINTNESSTLSYNYQKSENLERGTNLTVLGFPFGIGANAIDDINPIYGNAIVSVPGLQDGLILTTDTNYESGNSGGPVFYSDESGSLVVIGIVSASIGNNTGFIVPISVIK